MAGSPSEVACWFEDRPQGLCGRERVQLLYAATSITGGNDQVQDEGESVAIGT